jgi:hypothetical protein
MTWVRAASSTNQIIDNWITLHHARVFAAPNLVGGHFSRNVLGMDEGGGPNL